MNFAIVEAAYGDFWIGKTNLPVKGTSIFSNYSDALEEAKQWASYNNILEIESSFEAGSLEEISKDDEKFIR